MDKRKNMASMIFARLVLAILGVKGMLEKVVKGRLECFKK